MTPLEIARKRQKESGSVECCFDCANCVKVGGWWYCEDSGKMLHPLMLERTGCGTRCDRAVLKEET